MNKIVEQLLPGEQAAISGKVGDGTLAILQQAAITGSNADFTPPVSPRSVDTRLEAGLDPKVPPSDAEIANTLATNAKTTDRTTVFNAETKEAGYLMIQERIDAGEMGVGNRFVIVLPNGKRISQKIK